MSEAEEGHLCSFVLGQGNGLAEDDMAQGRLTCQRRCFVAADSTLLIERQPQEPHSQASLVKNAECLNKFVNLVLVFGDPVLVFRFYRERDVADNFETGPQCREQRLASQHERSYCDVCGIVLVLRRRPILGIMGIVVLKHGCQTAALLMYAA